MRTTHSSMQTPRPIISLAVLILFVTALAAALHAAPAQGEKPAHVAPGASGQSGAGPTAVDSLAWMAGYWVGEADGQTMEELWLPPAGGVIIGVHRDVTASGRLFFEYLRIESRPDGAYYVAKPSTQPEGEFKLASISRSGAAWRAVFENPTHDFPQRITYERDGDVLTAAIHGIVDGKERSSSWVMKRASLANEAKETR